MTDGNNAGPTFLWNVRYKINSPDGGLNFKLAIPDKTEVNARAIAVDIGLRLRSIMPSTCEIFSASMSKSNTKKDGKLLPNVIGDGQYGQSGATPAPTTYNRYDDCINVRAEDGDGQWVIVKIGPVPDTIISGGDIVIPIAAVLDTAGPLPAIPVQPVTYNTEFTNLMLAIAKGCARVESKTNMPGGTYKFALFNAMHVIKVGKKKGGRIFKK